MSSKLSTFFATHLVFTVPDLDTFLAREGLSNTGTRHTLLTHHLCWPLPSSLVRASWADERIAGVRDTVSNARMPQESVMMISGDARLWHFHQDPVALGYGAVKEALASGWIPAGGIVGITDDYVKGLIAAAAEIGLKPGIDFAAVGFDDHPDDAGLGLTTMRPPVEDMGRAVVRLLMGNAQGVQTSRRMRLCGHLLPRSSTQYTPKSE